ncbi:MAG: 1-(5-phosphoribosyl)-5-[(5-phosphoribosylamino)methylideneamino]imidazole-4-carboxamide isomerase [Oscillospiraceae bacterium]|nr:1-(5-phosphoribosyl)-5-[(5-phosphoribosylamino)methylideneamino]imidazole-4-carboxamide isomerase [Oscillospiraceae bacterium]
MEIFPAIDIMGGKVVNLVRGEFDLVDVYGEDPVAAAEAFKARGAANLHIVDLDGAKSGSAENFSVIENIVKTGGLFIQVGGGIRSAERAAAYLAMGVNRVILGTAAVEDFSLLERLLTAHGASVAVGVDARNGSVAVKGWLEDTALDSFAFCEKLDAAGVDNIIYTDIMRDGMMEGANYGAYRELTERVKCKITASGGICSLDELKKLEKLGVYAAILGRSLYTGAVKLEDALCLQNA